MTTVLDLPTEVVLNILDLLDPWDDKCKFASADPRLWCAALRMRSNEPYIIEARDGTNVLRLAVSKHIVISAQTIPSDFMVAIIKYAHAAQEMTFMPRTDYSHNYISQILYYVARHRAYPQHLTFSLPCHMCHAWERTYEDSLEKYGSNRLPNVQFLDEKGATVFGLVDDEPKILDDNDLDGYETLEEIVEATKYMKRSAVLAGQARRRDGSSVINVRRPPFLLACPALRSLLDTRTQYIEEDSATALEEELLLTYVHNRTSIDDVIERYGRRYIESIIVFGKFWFFVTSVDAFVHHQAGLDDCADSTEAPFAETTRASIKARSSMGWEYFELSIRIGFVEFLAVGGFWGHVDSHGQHLFLGFSLADLPAELRKSHNATTVLVRTTPASISRSNRLLRQYAKAHSGLLWSFHSLQYAAKGFYPVHPAAYSNHTSAVTAGQNNTHHLASFVLRCILKRSVQRSELEEMLVFATRVKSMQETFTPEVKSFASLKAKSEEQGNLSKNVYVREVIGQLALLEQVVDISGGDGEGVRRTITHSYEQMRPAVLTIMNTGLVAAIKAANTKVMRRFQQRYMHY